MANIATGGLTERRHVVATQLLHIGKKPTNESASISLERMKMPLDIENEKGGLKAALLVGLMSSTPRKAS